MLNTVYLYREGANANRAHRVVVSRNVVQLIEIVGFQNSEPVLLDDLVQQYGPPTMVEWSRESPSSVVIVYPHIGVLANVASLPYDEAQVTSLVYFVPRTRLRVMVDFARWLSPTDPFPNSDGVGPKDPWFDTSKDCRYVCNEQDAK